MKKLVLIDGNSLLNRAYYATPVFTTRDGMPTNAIFGFIKLVFKIVEDLNPNYMVVAFDLKAPTFRHKMYSGYKATRKPMPEDLAAQVMPLKELLKAMKISTCEAEGFEADDIIGTLSKKFDVHSYIYTGDRDSFQLVDDKTDVYFTRKGVSDLQKLSADNFVDEVGLKPCQIVDLKALMGDKSDNIPGVAGVGEKTAVDLINKYGSLDGVYENIDEIKGSLQEKLKINRTMAYLSYRLATIVRDCELDIELENCTVLTKYGADVKKIFTELEFKSLLALDIFGDDTAAAEQNSIVYPELKKVVRFEDLKPVLTENNKFAVVLDDLSASIYAGGVEYEVEVKRDLLSEGISDYEFCEILKIIFTKTENTVTAFECKRLMHELDKRGVAFDCKFEDLDLAKYLCDLQTIGMDLKALCAHEQYDYKFRAFAVNSLFDKYLEIMRGDGTYKLYSEIEKPLLSILFEMESTGVKVSIETLDELSAHYKELLEKYSEKVYEKCGCKFNLNSPSQLGEVLYTKLGLTSIKKKKTGKYTTSAEVLEKLADECPVIGDILKFRLYQKLYSTYIEGFRPLINRDGIVHTTYNQTVATTGRLSSANPNLQNIPIREDEGRELRKIFIPRDGNVFIDADYSQIELRLLAHFSECKELVEAYNKGIDIHAVTASQVFGVDLSAVTPKMRREAKAVNFGIIYGISEFGLAKNLNISVGTAREYIEKYFATYSAVKEYMNSNVEFAHKHGYVSTLTGRKRVIPEIRSTNYNIRQFGERAAMNMPLQGSSADIIKIAMINVAEALKKEGLKSKLILQVHDELVLEAPIEEVEVASEILKREMEGAVKLKVPLTVEVHCGKNWYEAK